ncbi:MAG: lactonase family protein [Burkholderiales bacterium]|nr:lactonase family protein [Burkholderiales bacterium]
MKRIAMAWTLAVGSAFAQSTDAPLAPLDFLGRALVVVSDADMQASAYVDGRLGPTAGDDTLSVIAMGRQPRELRAAAVAVSNSVAGPPVAVAVTPDGSHAIVVETFAPRPAGKADARFGDLRFGNRVQVVDLSDLARPRVVQTIDGPVRPDAVSINADGTLVAIAVHPNGDGTRTPLVLYPFAQGRLGAPVMPDLPGWRPGERLIHAEFHPSQPVLALVNETRAELSFVRVAQAGRGWTVQPWGNTVRIEKSPYMVRFTPDGRHALVNALYWGADVQGTWNEAPRGSVVSVRVEARNAPDGTVVHALVSRAMTGVSPEGLTVSPDGKLAATTNLERSFLPFDDARQTFYSSITLLRIDPRSGTLSRVADFAYDGILPEAAVFDGSSRFLAVATFDHYDGRRAGSVDFWRIARDPLDAERLELVKTSYSVPVTRGAHSMVLVR